MQVDIDMKVRVTMRGKEFEPTRFAKGKETNHIKRLAAVLAGMVLGLMPAVPAPAADCDLAILNGRVMDPATNYDAVANVGIKMVLRDGVTTALDLEKGSILPNGMTARPGTRWEPTACLPQASPM